MSEINVILRNVRRFWLTKEQMFRLWKCALKDDDKLVDAVIEKLYDEMIAFNLAHAECVMQLIIERDEHAEPALRSLLKEIAVSPCPKADQQVPWGCAPRLSTTQHLQQPDAPQELISSQSTRNKSNVT